MGNTTDIEEARERRAREQHSDHERLTILVEKSIASAERANDRLDGIETDIGRLLSEIGELRKRDAEHHAERKRDLKVTGYAGTSVATAIAVILAELLRLVGN